MSSEQIGQYSIISIVYSLSIVFDCYFVSAKLLQIVNVHFFIFGET